MLDKEPIALITGASGGIGRALVQVFHNASYHVIATDRTSQPENLTCAHYIQADLARITNDEDYANETFAFVRRILNGSGLNVLINNAAVQIQGSVYNLNRNDWRNTLDVNLLAPFFLTQALLPDMEAVGGCVINISSIHARLTKRNFVAYATSKAALSGLTRALAVDLGNRVRINAIEPAAIETPMLRESFKNNISQYEQLEACHPQQRIGHPEEVAQLALAIASGNMNFLHGACIGLDGGISARLHDPE